MTIHGLLANLGIEGLKLLPVHIGFRLLYRRFDSDVCAIDDSYNSLEIWEVFVVRNSA